jgi:hypothetical protein
MAMKSFCEVTESLIVSLYEKADRDLKYDGKKTAAVADKLVENS